MRGAVAPVTLGGAEVPLVVPSLQQMTLPRASRRVIDAADAAGLQIEVTEFPQGTKTARDAADAIGCDVAAIVKSLVFLVDAEPVIALVPGDRRLDEQLLAAAAGGAEVARADLERVRAATGYAAGGTPPFGHATEISVFADEALRRHDPVWAAAGTPTTVFPIALDDLDRLVVPRWVPLS